METDMCEKQLLAVELNAVRDADVANRTARPRGANRLHHGLLGAHALQSRIGADPVGQLLDAGDAVVSALGHDIGCAKLAGELLPMFVRTHSDDSRGTQPPALRGPVRRYSAVRRRYALNAPRWLAQALLRPMSL